MGTTLEILERARTIAKRTAQHGLDDAATSEKEKARWFYIWCGDVAGELAEAIKVDSFSDEYLTEIGDLLWGISAVSLLLEIPSQDIDFSGGYLDGEHEILLTALDLIEHGKKVCRDAPKRGIDCELVTQRLARIYSYCVENVGVQYLSKALDLVDAKLQKRYPNGYTQDASVNRSI